MRNPVLKAFAKQIQGSKEADAFLSTTPHFYLEENNLHGYLLGFEKNIENALGRTEKFLPFIDNWCTNDLTVTSLKILGKNTNVSRSYVEKWIDSDLPFTVRFGTVCLMCYFLGEAFDWGDMQRLASIKIRGDYYVDMGVAWYLATALLKQYEKTINALETKMFDPWIHNKAISKACDSFRVPPHTKSYLKSLRIALKS